MLNRLLIHLKNVIFFKLTIYLLMIIFLVVIIPTFIDDLDKSKERKRKANDFLQETSLKIQSIDNFEEKLVELDKAYRNLTNSKINLACEKRHKLITDVEEISNKNRLEKISVRITKGYNDKDFFPDIGNVKLSYHIADITFKAQDYIQFLSIIRDIFEIMPAGSVVISCGTIMIDSLTPEIIATLNTIKAPELLDAKIKILLRDIVYEK